MDGRRVNVIASGVCYRYCYTVSFTERLERVRFGMLFKTVTGVELAGQVSDHEDGGLPVVDPSTSIDIAFEFENRLLPGTYFGNAGVSAVGAGGQAYAHRVLDAIMFRVLPSRAQGSVPTAAIDLKVSRHSSARIHRTRSTISV
jgi:lipopolysaccharide transport system ATP-binding protein